MSVKPASALNVEPQPRVEDPTKTSVLDLRPGTQIGKFTLIRKIASGGMGVVYLARDTITDAEVALKVLLPAANRDPRQIGRFKRELLICQKLSHPNIVRVFDIGQDRGFYFISMEVLDGEDLQSILQREPRLSTERIAEIVSSILSAIEGAHAVGVIHCDIKPGNIFLTRDGTVKMLDFGIAHCMGLPFHTSELSIIGTPSYMSPEQAEGQPHPDGRADLYSVGVILYEMLTGRVPFQGTTPVSAALARLRELPTPVTDWNPDIPSGLARVVMRALQKDPKKRFQTAGEFREALAEAAGIQQQPPKVPSPPPSRLRSAVASVAAHKRAASVAGLGLLAVAVLVAWQVANGFSNRQAYAHAYELLRAGDRAGAQGAFAQLGKSRLERAWQHEGFAAVSLGNGRLEETEAEVREALALKPDLAYALILEGDLESAAGKIDKALEKYQQAALAKAGLEWQKALAFCRQAQVALLQGDLPAAEQHLKSATRLSAWLPELHYLRAQLEMARGSDAKAQEQLATVLEHQPNDPIARLLLADVDRRVAAHESKEKQEELASLVRTLAERYRESRKSGAASAKAQDTWTSRPRTLWLLSLEQKGGLGAPPGLAPALEVGLARALAAEPGTRVVERELIDALLRELNLASSEMAAPGTALELGRLVGARFLLVPGINSFRGETTFNLRVIEVETSEIVATLSDKLDPDDNPASFTQGMAARIDQKLKERFPLRGRVVSVGKEGVLLNIGSSVGVAPGMDLALLAPAGEEAYRSGTVHTPAAKIGSIKVDRVDAEAAYGTASGEIAPQQGYLVEDLPANPSAGSPA